MTETEKIQTGDKRQRGDKGQTGDKRHRGDMGQTGDKRQTERRQGTDRRQDKGET